MLGGDDELCCCQGLTGLEAGERAYWLDVFPRVGVISELSWRVACAQTRLVRSAKVRAEANEGTSLQTQALLSVFRGSVESRRC